MRRTATHRLASTLIALLAAVSFAGCAGDAGVAPDSFDEPARLGAADGSASLASGRDVDLGSCTQLTPPAGTSLVVRMYAQGVQIYRWNGTAWAFVAPEANLSADPAGRSTVGTHYAGPTWQGNSGGWIRASVIDRCTPDANSIQWLLLGVTAKDGPGIFHRVTHVQRVNTSGGIAPTAPGSMTGQEARVPYTTEYLFWRAP
jgi:hypothetical protein